MQIKKINKVNYSFRFHGNQENKIRKLACLEMQGGCLLYQVLIKE